MYECSEKEENGGIYPKLFDYFQKLFSFLHLLKVSWSDTPLFFKFFILTNQERR